MSPHCDSQASVFRYHIPIGQEMSFTYNDFRRETVQLERGLTRRFFLNADGSRLTEKWHPNGINSQYRWNPDNTLAGVYNRVAFSDAYTISRHDYVYDGLGRRQSAQYKAGTLTSPAQNDSYGYDALGNRSRKTVNGVEQYAIHDAANQLVELRSGSATGAITQRWTQITS